MSTTLAGLMVVGDQVGTLTQALASGMVAVSPRWTLGATQPVQHVTGGSLQLWDGILQASYRAVDTPTAVVEVRPGVTVPLAPVGDGAPFIPGATGSVDPWLAASGFVGKDWLFLWRAQGRLPLYEGADARTQGAWVRADVGGARRLGPTVVAATVSGVRGFAGQPLVVSTAPYSELAARLQVEWSVSAQSALRAETRLPLVQEGDGYAAAVGLAWTQVWGTGASDGEP